jgi:predicted RNA-binding protein YlqC (UPF0109 family)
VEIANTPTSLPRFRKTYEDLLTDILVALVEAPQDLNVVELEDNGCLHFEVVADKEDHGRIIGKHGSTIGALHKLFTSIARGRFVKIDIKDNEA